MSGTPPGGTRRAGIDWTVGTQLDAAETLGAPAYTEAEVVGAGRRGWTVRARRLIDGRRVALKVGSRLGSERARRRFMDDAAVVEGLPALPHVAPVVAAGSSADGLPWLVTPWYDGGSVAGRLKQGPRPLPEAVEAARRATTAVAALHRAGLLHANLTPGCLLFDAYGEVWLDGMALSTLAPDTPDSTTAGASSPGIGPLGAGPAPAHLPPEVLEGEAWSGPGDVWALGSCLHTMLAGQPPWNQVAQRGTVDLLLAMATGQPAAPARTDVPVWLGALIEACLAAHAAERPSAEAALAEIERHDPSPSPTVTTGPVGAVEHRAGGAEERPLGSSYMLIEPIGSGASGQVWRGRRRWDGGAVAVKVLRPELASEPEMVARFLRERTTLVGLDHPNLVPILDLVAEGETLAIVMELVEGPNLRRLLARRGPPPPSEACRLLAQVASGLARVHGAGIVHRDLKPENVLVERPETPSARARLTDFGVARTLTGLVVTRSDQLVGTAGYLAPELVAGRTLTPAADVYGLGVLSYELLTGALPFNFEHAGAILRAHLDLDPARPAGLPDALWAVVAGCMAKDPAARPDVATAGAALERLVGELAGVAPWQGPAPAAPVRAGPDAASSATAAGIPLPPPPAPRPAPDPPGPGWGRIAPTTVGPQAGLAGPEGHQPSLAGADGRPWGPAAGDERLTHVSSLPLAPAPTPEPSGDRPRSWSRRARLGALAAAGVVAAGAGIAVALNRPGPTLPKLYPADVTARVTATGVGAVTVAWADVGNQPGFDGFLLRRDGLVSPQTQDLRAGGPTTVALDGVPAGSHCFRVTALFRGRVPVGLAPPAAATECVTVR